MKKIPIIILVFIILLSPTYIAIINYSIISQKPENYSSVSGIEEITDPAGRVYYLDENDSNAKEFYELMSKINKGAKKFSLPDVSELKYYNFEIVYKSVSENIVFNYFFSTDNKRSYMLDSAGNAFIIPDAYAQKFLLTPYAAGIYDHSSPPQLISNTGDTILPSSLSWNYIIYDNSFVNLKNPETTSEILSYKRSGRISFSFSIAPDYSAVKAYDSTGLIYQGTLENLSYANIDESKALTLDIEATWLKNSSLGYYGTSRYHFTVEPNESAKFYLSENSISSGEFVVLTCTNIADISKITFSSEPDIKYTPVFFEDGIYVRALIPMSIYLESPKTYRFTISCGNAIQHLDLYVAKRDVLERQYNTSAKESEFESAMAEYKSLLKNIGSSYDNTKYFDGTFIDYSEDSSIKASIFLGFGHQRTVFGKYSYRMDGVDFNTDSTGSDIPAANSGNVIYKGSCAYLGNFVVIDHGFGLKSWYANLSEIGVAVGDNVVKGQSVGKSGNTGFSYLPGVYFMTTVFDVPVSPYTLWSEGIDLGNY